MRKALYKMVIDSKVKQQCHLSESLNREDHSWRLERWRSGEDCLWLWQRSWHLHHGSQPLLAQAETEKGGPELRASLVT